MDVATHIDEIRQNGYVILPSLLSQDDILELKTALAPWLQGEHMGRNDFEGFRSERVYALLAKSPAFSKIVAHPAILPILSALLEPDYLLSANLAINSHPGETPQAFHRDNNGGNGASVHLVHGVSTIWNLDDFTADNGATELIPGSHLWETEAPVENDARAIPALMPAGSALVFLGTLYHRGGANRSSAARLAITPQYCQPWLRQLENMVLAVPPATAATLPARVQSLLGYSVRAPGFMGMVDGVHPKRLLDSGYAGRKSRGEAS